MGRANWYGGRCSARALLPQCRYGRAETFSAGRRRPKRVDECVAAATARGGAAQSAVTMDGGRSPHTSHYVRTVRAYVAFATLRRDGSCRHGSDAECPRRDVRGNVPPRVAGSSYRTAGTAAEHCSSALATRQGARRRGAGGTPERMGWVGA
ncbi:hypothetical protein VTO73DRAFT_5123 [Trametes versicolor]